MEQVITESWFCAATAAAAGLSSSGGSGTRTAKPLHCQTFVHFCLHQTSPDVLNPHSCPVIGVTRNLTFDNNLNVNEHIFSMIGAYFEHCSKIKHTSF